MPPANHLIITDSPPAPPPLLPSGSRVLLCVLDWGLGHASRSLALARMLEAEGHPTAFASCGRALAFLRAERPDLVFHELPAYDVTYPTRFMALNVAWQFPRWLRTIWRERRCTKKLVEQYGYSHLVSDNRFGCYVPGVPSVFLTHQLHPITHNWLVSRLYRLYLQRFTEFWVPDLPDQRLSGLLSDASGYRSVRYIGWLSRLIKSEQLPTATEPVKVLALLSGPEPMRTQLEEIVLSQLTNIPGPHLLVRGLPGGASPLANVPANIKVKTFATAEMLAKWLPAAERIICRSGYSTLMDVYAVTDGRKLILVPTPGQTEQIYLAEREAKRVGCEVFFDQNLLDLRGG